MTSRARLIIFAGGLALATPLAIAVAQANATGTARAGHKVAAAFDRMGSALVDFYGGLPAGVPVGP